MQFGDTVMLLSRLAVGAMATFLAIILWSRTRDTAWMFVIIGTVVAYGETVFGALELFGLVRRDLIVLSGVSVVKLVLVNLPLVFFSIGFLAMILRKEFRRKIVREPKTPKKPKQPKLKTSPKAQPEIPPETPQTK
jgi:hypothetical protein